MILCAENLNNLKAVPERSEIPQQDKWNLEAIYKSFDDWESAFDLISKKIQELAGYAGKLGDNNGDNLLKFLKADEEVSLELGKLYVYANMKSHEDLRVTKPMELAGRAEKLMTDYAAANAFFQPELLSLNEKDLNSWLEREDLKLYKFFVFKILREREHILSQREEELLARVGELSAVPENAFSLLTNADLKFPDIKDESGNLTELTEERWYRLSRSLDREVRRNAFLGIHGTYDKFKNSIGALYSGSVKGDIFYAKTRKYEDSLEAALFNDNVSSSVYDNVVDTASKYSPLMHRLVSLRRKALGLDELRYYDLNVPISNEPVDDNIKYEDACEMVLNALEPLGQDYIKNFKKGLSEHWIDVYENQGKRKGAYSWGSYGTHPYVLLNYNGTLRDVFTLAHEMGHSLHSFYSHSNQPQVYAEYTILLAEVASTTNEALLLGYLLKNAKSQEDEKWLLNYYYDMVRTTFFRQAMFADFERRTHKHAEAGGVLTPEYMGDLWRELNAKCYGPEMIIDDELCAEWARIPHFYSAFYVYKYVTGFTAANAFASAILNHEPEAVNKYLGFLKSGGSDFSLNILKRAGVDLSSAEPFERAMRLFEERLGEGEKLW
ncbi:MAG: oligoendopeptidase F [Synergistaceae bacterium]|nr:oligoendopeptidase F [Synergistaceae bacterium]